MDEIGRLMKRLARRRPRGRLRRGRARPALPGAHLQRLPARPDGGPRERRPGARASRAQLAVAARALRLQPAGDRPDGGHRPRRPRACAGAQLAGAGLGGCMMVLIRREAVPRCVRTSSSSLRSRTARRPPCSSVSLSPARGCSSVPANRGPAGLDRPSPLSVGAAGLEDLRDRQPGEARRPDQLLDAVGVAVRRVEKEAAVFAYRVLTLGRARRSGSTRPAGLRPAGSAAGRRSASRPMSRRGSAAREAIRPSA